MMSDKHKTSKTSPKRKKTTSLSRNMPTDAFFKKAMDIKPIAMELLQTHLPPELYAKLKPETVEKIDSSFVEKHLVRKLSDVVLKVERKDKPDDDPNKDCYIYLLCENQSTSDPKMPLRMMNYLCLLAEQLYSKVKDNKTKLPLIYPVVLYNGVKKYSAPLEFAEMFEDPEMMAELLRKTPLIDLSQIEDEIILKQSLLGAIELNLKYSRMKEKLDIILNSIQALKNTDQRSEMKFFTDDKKFAFDLIIYYNLNKLEKEDLPIILEAVRDNFTEGEEQMGSLVESLHKEGYDNGMVIGVGQGITQERQNIIQNMLRKGLDVSFIADATEISIQEILEIKTKMDK